MSVISGINSAMHLASDSLGVHSVGMRVTTHNIANVSTAEFEPQRATYATGPDGIGVALESVRKVPAFQISRGDVPGDMNSIWGGNAPSGTELATEFPRMIATQHGYDANAAVIRTADSMYDSLLDLKA